MTSPLSITTTRFQIRLLDPFRALDQHGRAKLVDLFKQGHQLQRTRRIEVAGRLVRNDEGGLLTSARAIATLLLTAGKIHRLRVRLIGQTDQIETYGTRCLMVLALMAPMARMANATFS